MNGTGSNQSVGFSMNFMGIEKEPFDIPVIRWTYVLLYCVIFLSCVLGNATVIYVILRHRKMRNVTNFFLANLAASDLCVGLFCVLPNLASYITPLWYLGRVMCKMYYFIQCTSYAASVMILTVMSLERYFAIIHPILNKRVTRMCLLRAIIVVVWICAALYGVPYLVVYDTVDVSMDGNSTVSFCVLEYKNVKMEAYWIINFVVLYVLPLLLISVMYTRISVALWKTSQAMAGMSSGSSVPRSADKSSSADGNRVNRKGQLVCQRCGNAVDLGKVNTRSERSVTNAEATESDVSKKRKKFVFMSVNSKWAQSVDDEIRASGCVCSKDGKKNKKSVSRRISGCYAGSKRSISNAIHKSKSKPKPSNALLVRRKVIRLLICIIISFALCVLPHHARILWQNWSGANAFSFGHMLIPPSTFLFFYANSALNPFLYALLSDHFRKAFRDLLPRCCYDRKRLSRDATFLESRLRRTSMSSEGQTLQVMSKTVTTNGSPSLTTI